MDHFIYDSIPKTENANEFLNIVGKKYTKFSKNELLNTLYSTFYNETTCYNKFKTICMEFDSDYVVWLIMGTLPL